MTRETSPERPSRFASTRDEQLYLMACEAWGTDSDGSLDSPLGWFSCVTNRPEELAEIQQAFDDYPVFAGDISALTGNFVVVEQQSGQVSVYEFPTEAEAWEAYSAMSAAFVAWVEAQKGMSEEQAHE